MAFSVLRDHARAEEVTQDAFLNVWVNSSREPTRGQALPWMLAITHGRAVDVVRSSQASSTREVTWGLRQREVAIDATSEWVHAKADARRVRAALGSVTDKQRVALALAYFGGHTHPEVALRLDIPVGTAKSRIREGLRTMAVSLEHDAQPSSPRADQACGTS